MYGPAARRKRDFQDSEREVLHQCIRPRIWSICAPGQHGYPRGSKSELTERGGKLAAPPAPPWPESAAGRAATHAWRVRLRCRFLRRRRECEGAKDGIVGKSALHVACMKLASAPLSVSGNNVASTG